MSTSGHRCPGHHFGLLRYELQAAMLGTTYLGFGCPKPHPITLNVEAGP